MECAGAYLEDPDYLVPEYVAVGSDAEATLGAVLSQEVLFHDGDRLHLKMEIAPDGDVEL